MKAVRFYIKSNFRMRYTLKTLGYPSSAISLYKWGEVFGDNVIVTAIIDRVVHHCDIVKSKCVFL